VFEKKNLYACSVINIHHASYVTHHNLSWGNAQLLRDLHSFTQFFCLKQSALTFQKRTLHAILYNSSSMNSLCRTMMVRNLFTVRWTHVLFAIFVTFVVKKKSSSKQVQVWPALYYRS